MSAVIADTSVWIDYFRNKEGAVGDAMEELIKDGDVRGIGIVITELVSGAANERERELIKNLLSTAPYLEVKWPIWWKAGEMLRDTRRKGFTASLPDAVIAATAIHYDAELFTLDRHFDAIGERTPLKLFNYRQ